MREAWNDRFAAGGADFTFDAQAVTIAVPASFDAVAQRLTLAAAQTAGYPPTVRLLEEPQAALYHWLESNAAGPRSRTVLVVDIGGGTSDFSLFAFDPAGDDARIERIAVSDHILLGGDNMDLALAHRLEPQFTGAGESLSGRQWDYLVARCRDLKEAALASDGAPADVFSVALPGRGSRLIAQAQSAQITRAEIEALLLDGFFPACNAGEYPLRAQGALRELAYPTLAIRRLPGTWRTSCVNVRPSDAVLYNGGALGPLRVRQRISEQIGIWRAGPAPLELINEQPDLAVAQGAARFGKLVRARGRRIEAGAAQAIFLQVQRSTGATGPPVLVCVLPQGAPSEKTFAIADLALEVRINELVRFQAFSSTRHGTDRAGDLVSWNDRDFKALAPLETSVHAPVAAAVQHGTSGATATRTLPVRLSARLSELGRLEIACHSTDPGVPGAWPFDFNLRPQATNAGDDSHSRPAHAVVTDAGPDVSADALDAARARIRTMFGRPLEKRDRLTATRLLKSLETLLGRAKSQWNVVLVRSLWATLERCMAERARSVDHEEAWLIVAGFLLRPGLVPPWTSCASTSSGRYAEAGWFSKRRPSRSQVTCCGAGWPGGLSGDRQESLLAAEWPKLSEPRGAAPELVLLAGSLERSSRERKSDLIESFIATAAALEREGVHNAHFLGALGSLLARAPLYAGPETVVSAQLVQHAFDAFASFDWGGGRVELQTLFLRAARAVDNRGIDVPRALRNRIADKLEAAGVAPARTAPLRDYMPLPRADRARHFGESLPPGLILRE